MFFNDTATTEIYTLSLHDALPISARLIPSRHQDGLLMEPVKPMAKVTREEQRRAREVECGRTEITPAEERSEEHTSELQSRQYLVCRLLLEKKKLPADAVRLLQRA